MNTKKQFRVYRANSSKTGSALSVDINAQKESIFLEFASQKEERSFDWANKLSIKLSALEVAKICTLYDGKISEIKLYHDPKKGDYNSSFKNAMLNISKLGNNYNFKNSQQSSAGVRAISISVSTEEMLIITTIFKRFIEEIYLGC